MKNYQITDRRYPHRWCRALHTAVATLVVAFLVTTLIMDALSLLAVFLVGGVIGVIGALLHEVAARRRGQKAAPLVGTPRPGATVWEPRPVLARLAVAGDIFNVLVVMLGITVVLWSQYTGGEGLPHPRDYLSWAGFVALAVACLVSLGVDRAHRRAARPVLLNKAAATDR
jgi:hypothetical protein